jgi:hypothetical protein
MAPKSVDARITLGWKPAAEVQELTLGLAPETLAAPPFSVISIHTRCRHDNQEAVL